MELKYWWITPGSLKDCKMEPITFKVKKCQTPSDFSASFSLQLVGSLPVHSLTTMSMLPWIVAEIRMLSTKSSKEEPSVSQIRLYVSPASLRCEPDTGKIQQWDPLICSSLFEYKPQHVHKLIHNSQDPSYFACLIKDGAANQRSICYVFKADDQTKVSKKKKKQSKQPQSCFCAVWNLSLQCKTLRLYLQLETGSC